MMSYIVGAGRIDSVLVRDDFPELKDDRISHTRRSMLEETGLVSQGYRGSIRDSSAEPLWLHATGWFF